ncbi:hypothetical protein [Actinomadura yumaensis]|uniref:Uncharacterized protein n=1 Tax=Actinomadura yumaensis TaxID=111807 RepID=A0ABW2CNP9_9ACTN
MRTQRTWTAGPLRYTLTRPPARKNAEFEHLHPRGRGGRFTRKPWVLHHHDPSAAGSGGNDFADWGDRAAAIRRARDRYPDLHDLFRTGDAVGTRAAVLELLDSITWPDGAIPTAHVDPDPGQSLYFGIEINLPSSNAVLLHARREVLQRPATGRLHVMNEALVVDDAHRGGKWAAHLNAALEDWYIASGINRVFLTAADIGAYAWASAGYDWDPDGYTDDERGNTRLRGDIEAILDSIAEHARYPETLDLIARYRGLLDGPRIALPTPYELSRIEYQPGATMWAGKAGMIGMTWYGEKYLEPPAPETKTMADDPAATAERRARLARLAELHRRWVLDTPGADDGQPGPGTTEDALHAAVDEAGLFPDADNDR